MTGRRERLPTSVAVPRTEFQPLLHPADLAFEKAAPFEKRP